jgi:hypothetical protein
MQAFVKRGALVCLVLLAAPFVVIISRNPFLVLPLWLSLGYVAATQLAPAARRPFAPAVAVITGQLAYRVLQALAIAPPWPILVLLAALAAALAWLVVTGSRWAVAATAAMELVALAIPVLSLSQFLAFARDVSEPVAMIPPILALYASPVAAIALLAPFLRPASRAERLGEVFD